MISYQPRKQRKMLYKAPNHRRRKMMRAHLSDELYARYGVRNLVVRKGDIVRVMRGNFKGHEGKVVEVNLKKMKVAVEGVIIRRTDNKSVQRWLDPSNLMIIKLNLTDPKRKEKLYRLAEEKRGISIEELEMEERREEEIVEEKEREKEEGEEEEIKEEKEEEEVSNNE